MPIRNKSFNITSSQDTRPTFKRKTVPVRVVDVILDATHPEYEKYGRSNAIGAIKYSIADRAIDAEIILVIAIDKEGAMSLNSVEDPNYVLSDVSGLEDILTQAVAQVPNALPAVKTNADARVSVSLKLPVQIVAQPAE